MAFTNLVNLEADCGVSGGSHRVDRELARWVLEAQRENGVDAGVGVLHLHVEVGEWGAEGDILLDGDLVLGLVEGGHLVVDVPDGDGEGGLRAGGGVASCTRGRM